MQEMEAGFQEFVKKLENRSSDSPVVNTKPWIRNEPMKSLLHTADWLEHEPLAVAFTNLMAMDDPFDNFPRTFSPPLDTGFPKKPCYLFGIPRELRDIISDIAISAGDISILQTSKQLHHEGIGFLYKRRICHVNINLTKHVCRFSLPEHVAALIQNVNIKIISERGVSLRRWGRDLEPLRKFSGLTVPRQMCRVVLLYSCNDDLFDHWTRMDVPYRVMEGLKTLIGFSRVIVEVHCRGQVRAREEELRRRRWRIGELVSARKDLSYGLGPWTWHETAESDGGYLEFHPREHWKQMLDHCHQKSRAASINGQKMSELT